MFIQKWPLVPDEGIYLVWTSSAMHAIDPAPCNSTLYRYEIYALLFVEVHEWLFTGHTVAAWKGTYISIMER